MREFIQALKDGAPCRHTLRLVDLCGAGDNVKVELQEVLPDARICVRLYKQPGAGTTPTTMQVEGEGEAGEEEEEEEEEQQEGWRESKG